MLAALKKWGIMPKFYKPDWRTHNRDAQQGWGPINGFVVHNFGSDTSDPNSLAYLYNGDLARRLPGPLSQFAITDDGQVWVIGWGAANHTGFMDKDLHALVLKDAAPLAADFKPDGSGSTPSSGMGAVNPHYVGVEMTYGKAPTAAQRTSVARLGAALMDALGTGYTGGSVVGHRECTTQRSDPVGVPMWQLRRDINALLKAGTVAGSGTSTPAPAPSTPKPTTVTVTPSATRALAGSRVTLTATVTPAVAGTVRFDWAKPGSGTWTEFGGAVAVTGGKASISATPSSSVVYRARFYPADAKRYGVDWAPNVPVDVVTLADVAALEKRVAELEAKP